MAIVQYQVLYRYVHPMTKVPCTNQTKDTYDETAKFIKGYLPGESTSQVAAISEENSSTNSKYDMVFLYNGTVPINSYLEHEIFTKDEGKDAELSIISESFIRCKGEAWFVASTHSSSKAAIKSAEPLVRNIGKENVKVVKVVPLGVTVGLE